MACETRTPELSVTSTYTLLEEASGQASVKVRENILNRDHSGGTAGFILVAKTKSTDIPKAQLREEIIVSTELNMFHQSLMTIAWLLNNCAIFQEAIVADSGIYKHMFVFSFILCLEVTQILLHY